MNFVRNTSSEPSSTEYDYNYENDYSPCDPEPAKQFGESFLPVLYSLVFVFGLPGNALVMWVLLKCKRLKTMTDIYLLNLAISDLLFVASLPFWAQFAAGEWIWGHAMCKIIDAAYLLGYYGGIMFIILISIDRYLAVVYAVHSNKTRTVRYGVISSVVMWGVATLNSIPTLIYNQVGTVEGRNVCHHFFPSETISNWKLFTLFKANVLGFFLPLAIMVFCYASILLTLLRNKGYRRHRALKVIFAVVVVFLVFWTPHNVVLFLQSLKELGRLSGCGISTRLSIARQVTESITFVHCCLNPVIYAFLGQKFRFYLRRLFHRCLHPIRHKVHFLSRELTTSVRSQSCGDHDSSTVI